MISVHNIAQIETHSDSVRSKQYIVVYMSKQQVFKFRAQKQASQQQQQKKDTLRPKAWNTLKLY